MTVDSLQTFGRSPAPQVFRSSAPNQPITRTNTAQGRTAVARSAWLSLGVGLTATGVFYALYAIPDALQFMTCSVLLAVACLSFVVLHRPGQTLLAAKVASLLYAASFCYAPLWLYDTGAFRVAYYGLDARPLMGVASLITLVGYGCFLAGYFSLLRLLRPASSAYANVGASFDESSPTQSRQRRYALICALPMTLLGAICYVKLVAGSGGLNYLLSYSGGRADILSGVYGGWFWGAHLLFAAYGLFAVAAMRRHPWLCLVPTFALAALFVPLQGRDIVVGPVFCWLVFYHTLRKPVRWRTVMVGFVVIVMMSAMLGAFRNGGNRLALHDARGFLTEFSANLGKHLTTVVSANIDQLDTAMIAVRYVELQQETLGPMALMSWIAPLDRQFFGSVIPWIYTGVFMDLLVNPQHRGWKTALSPSLPGELYISLGWFGIVAGMLVYGALFGAFAHWSDRRAIRPLLFAAYPFVIYMTAKMIVDGTTHAFRPMIVFFAALACALLVPRGGTPRRNLAGVGR